MILSCYVSELEFNTTISRNTRIFKDTPTCKYSSNNVDTFLKVLCGDDIIEQGYHDNYFAFYNEYWSIKPKPKAIYQHLLVFFRKLLC